VAIASGDSYYVLRFDRDAYNEKVETGADLGDEGVEEAFDRGPVGQGVQTDDAVFAESDQDLVGHGSCVFMAKSYRPAAGPASDPIGAVMDVLRRLIGLMMPAVLIPAALGAT